MFQRVRAVYEPALTAIVFASVPPLAAIRELDAGGLKGSASII
jgi:hypothetical protein